MNFRKHDLVVSETGNRINFIGRISKTVNIFTSETSFLQRVANSPADYYYVVDGWDADGNRDNKIFMPDDLRHAFKFDFDKVILNLTKQKLLIESTIYEMEIVQKRALEVKKIDTN